MTTYYDCYNCGGEIEASDLIIKSGIKRCSICYSKGVEERTRDIDTNRPANPEQEAA